MKSYIPAKRTRWNPPSIPSGIPAQDIRAWMNSLLTAIRDFLQAASAVWIWGFIHRCGKVWRMSSIRVLLLFAGNELKNVTRNDMRYVLHVIIIFIDLKIRYLLWLNYQTREENIQQYRVRIKCSPINVSNELVFLSSPKTFCYLVTVSEKDQSRCLNNSYAYIRATVIGAFSIGRGPNIDIAFMWLQQSAVELYSVSINFVAPRFGLISRKSARTVIADIKINLEIKSFYY